MARGQFSSLLDVEIPIPVDINFNFLLKPVGKPVNWFTSLVTSQYKVIIAVGARSVWTSYEVHSTSAEIRQKMKLFTLLAILVYDWTLGGPSSNLQGEHFFF